MKNWHNVLVFDKTDDSRVALECQPSVSG